LDTTDAENLCPQDRQKNSGKRLKVSRRTLRFNGFRGIDSEPWRKSGQGRRLHRQRIEKSALTTRRISSDGSAAA
jgi:hypothetical protein